MTVEAPKVTQEDLQILISNIDEALSKSKEAASSDPEAVDVLELLELCSKGDRTTKSKRVISLKQRLKKYVKESFAKDPDLKGKPFNPKLPSLMMRADIIVGEKAHSLKESLEMLIKVIHIIGRFPKFYPDARKVLNAHKATAQWE